MPEPAFAEVLVTPELAERWLALRDERRNRGFDPARVKPIAADIADERPSTALPVSSGLRAVSADGGLLDKIEG